MKRLDALEAYSTLSALAMITKKVHLGTSVTNIQTRHPAVLAHMATTLDIMSGGRAVFGIGTGEAMNLDPYGVPWSRPVSRMREVIVMIKRLWTEDSVNYEGEFFKLDEAFLSPKPLQKPHTLCYFERVPSQRVCLKLLKRTHF